MQLAPFMIVLMAVIAINQVEGCPPSEPPGYMELRKYPKRSMYGDSPALNKLRMDVLKAVDESYYPTYGYHGRQSGGPQKPNLGADVGKIWRDLGQLLNQ